MAICAILMMSLIRLLKQAYSEIASTWHADDGSVARDFSTMPDFFNKLNKVGPEYY